MPWHTVAQGQCISSLAEQYGFTPERVWDDAENEALRELRGDANILEPGDRIFIPDREQKLVDCATNQTHRFVRHGVPAKLSLRLVDDGKGHGGRPFVARVGGKEIEGNTDGDGRIEIWIPPRATEVEITVGEGDDARVFLVQLGILDPVTTIRGVQARLDNLGFECEMTGELDEDTVEAITDFQLYIGHPEPSGELDDATRDALATLHDENR
jgi:hypothetical protein